MTSEWLRLNTKWSIDEELLCEMIMIHEHVERDFYRVSWLTQQSQSRHVHIRAHLSESEPTSLFYYSLVLSSRFDHSGHRTSRFDNSGHRTSCTLCLLEASMLTITQTRPRENCIILNCHFAEYRLILTAVVLDSKRIITIAES